MNEILKHYRTDGFDKLFDKDIKKNAGDKEKMKLALTLLRGLKEEAGYDDRSVRDYALKMSFYLRQRTVEEYRATQDPEYQQLYYEFLLFEAPDWFESYILFMESNRPYNKQFYRPRAKTLKVVVQDLQDLEDGEYIFYGLSLPARTGKSTICKFFISWVMGKRPWSHNAMSGHSGILADGFYNSILQFCTSKDYRFAEIFPDAPLTYKSTEKNEINLGEREGDFSTFVARGIEGTWTGAVDISSDGYLYVDDLVRDREESLSPTRLEARYQAYLNVLVDRKNDGARELMVGTRWNVLDPLGRIEDQFKDDPRYKFRKIPALNRYGKSNFEYAVKGFSTQYYLDLKKRLDPNEWMAKYMQEPFVREGILFPVDSLRLYNGELPDMDYRTVAVCDVAFGGGDSLSMPIARQYENGDVYIIDWVFSDKTKDSTIPLVVGRIIANEIRSINFEGNAGGDMYADAVSEQLREQGYKCQCTSSRAPTTMAKAEKIIACSDDIKRSFFFLTKTKRHSMYDNAMNELMTYVQIGKNLHDDAADSLAQLDMYIERRQPNRATQVIMAPTRMIGERWLHG